MDIKFEGFQVGADGAICVRQGLDSFPEHGTWAADDRLLAFFSQPSGGLSRLVFQGKQPQSANAFLLDRQEGGLLLTLEVTQGQHVFPVRHAFHEVVIYPYGWENTFRAHGIEFSSQLCLYQNGVIWQARCLNRSDELVRVSPSLSLIPSAMTEKVNGKRTWREPAIDAGTILLSARDQLQTRTWIDTPGFKDSYIDAESHILIAGESARDTVRDLSIFLQSEDITPGAWGRTRFFYITCRSKPSAAHSSLEELRSDPSRPFQRQNERYTARVATTPDLQVDKCPTASAVFRLAPIYIEACKVGETGALRSSAGGHYFVWGWDNLIAGHELARLGDAHAADALLSFIASHPAEEGCVPHRFDNDLQPLQVTGFDFISQLFISLLYQRYSESLDEKLLLVYFPFARRIFDELAARSGASGFYPSIGMYPDAPEKLGRSSESLVAYENGFWYCTCRMVEILARRAGDEQVSKRASELAVRQERAFLESFYDAERGFLVDALVGRPLASNGTYPRYSLFPLHNAFGAWLLRPVRQQVSDFIRRELVKPDGIRMVPEWDAHIGTETVTSTCWFLHFDLYCLKAFRRAGDADAIDEWIDLIDRFFTKRQVIPELQMLAEVGEPAQDWVGIIGQIWQMFALSGWTRGLLEGVLGLETDIGGITYIPCDLKRDVRLEGFPYRGGKWDITVTGNGAWVQRIVVDGLSIQGSYKIPEGFYTQGRHTLEIVRGTRPPSAPLILEATGASINMHIQNQESLKVELRADNEVNVCFFAPRLSRVMVDGELIEPQWDAASCTGTFSIRVQNSAAVELDML